MNNIISTLKIVFPGMMIVGALGSLAINLTDKENWPISLLWIGASLLYTALLFKNK